MDYKLDPVNEMIVKAAQDFCEREVMPIAEQIIENKDYPPELLEKLAKARMLGVTVPKEYGGVGSTNLNIVLIAEELGKTGTVCAWPMLMNNSTALCDGSAVASMAFTEPATGSDPAALTTTAVTDGDHFIVNGSKRFITGGNKKGYGLFYVKDEELKDQKGSVTALIVDKTSEGYSASEPWELMGLEGMNVVDVFLKDVRVPQSSVLGERGNGFRILLRWIAGERSIPRKGL
jgi:alkylation response protein AidB-like acyl-CoA dehydrogenase